MGIMVKESNKEKIEKFIKEEEGRATARTINYLDIVRDIDHIERTLGIAKKDMVGVEVDVDHNAQNFPAAYKYKPESTHYLIIRKSSGWELVSVGRYTTRREGHAYKIKLTDLAKQAIINSKMEF